jgi:hypothetical protein
MNKMKKVTFSEINEVREYELSNEEKIQKKDVYRSIKNKRKRKRKRKDALRKINIFFLHDPLLKRVKI